MHVACLVWYVEYSTRFFSSPASHADSFSPSVFSLPTTVDFTAS